MNTINLMDLSDIGEIKTIVSYPETQKDDQKYIDTLMARGDWKLLAADVVHICKDKQGMDGRSYIEKSFAFAYLLGRKRK